MSVLDILKRPFEWKDVEVKCQSTTKDKKRGLPVLYMTARAATRRLNEAFGLAWSTTYTPIYAQRGDSALAGVECAIEFELDGKTYRRANVGMPSEGEDHWIKGAYSDALKRALASLGCDALYEVDLPWVPITEDRYRPFDEATLLRLRELYDRQFHGVKVAAAPRTISMLLGELGWKEPEALRFIQNSMGKTFLTLQDAAARLTTTERVQLATLLENEIAIQGAKP